MSVRTARRYVLSEATREERLRQIAEQRGFRLRKSWQQDPWVYDYGLYAIFDADAGVSALPLNRIRTPYVFTLDEVAEWLGE